MFFKHNFGTPWGNGFAFSKGSKFNISNNQWSWRDMRDKDHWAWRDMHDDKGEGPADAPLANDDAERVVGRRPFELDLLANDLPGEDGDAGDLFISEINGQNVGRRKFFLLRDEDTGCVEGFVKINRDGTVDVKAFRWADDLSFSYRVSDGVSESEEAKVEIEVLDRNDTFTPTCCISPTRKPAPPPLWMHPTCRLFSTPFAMRMSARMPR